MTNFYTLDNRSGKRLKNMNFSQSRQEELSLLENS